MMEHIKIMTDSCSDLPIRLARERDITVVPLTVSFGSRHFTENVDIDSRLFFRLLTEDKENFPKTSQPNPEAFLKAYRDAEADGYTDVICINVSSKISGTFNSASIAKLLVSEESDSHIRVHLFDSLNASVAVGELVLHADDMAKSGASVEEILAELESLKSRIAMYFVLDTLEFVRRGGRIGNIKAVIGELLRVKPVLTFYRGLPVDLSKARSFSQVKDELIRLFRQRAESEKSVTLIHAAAQDRAQMLADDLSKLIRGIQYRIYEVGAVMGSYTGPGALGVIFREKKPRWAE